MDLPRSRSSFWALGRADTPGRGSNRRAEGTRRRRTSPSPYARLRSAFRLKPPARLFTPHPGEPASLLSGEFIPVRIGPRPISVDNPRSCRAAVNGAPVRSRSSSSNPRHSGPWSIRCSSTTSPHLADGFDCISGDSAVALGTLIRPRVGLDVFVERRLVDVSSCHRSHRVSGTRQYSEPSPIEGTITNAGLRC